MVVALLGMACVPRVCHGRRKTNDFTDRCRPGVRKGQWGDISVTLTKRDL